jgi:hypothetical protein
VTLNDLYDVSGPPAFSSFLVLAGPGVAPSKGEEGPPEEDNLSEVFNAECVEGAYADMLVVDVAFTFEGKVDVGETRRYIPLLSAKFDGIELGGWALVGVALGVALLLVGLNSICETRP